MSRRGRARRSTPGLNDAPPEGTLAVLNVQVILKGMVTALRALALLLPLAGCGPLSAGIFLGTQGSSSSGGAGAAPNSAPAITVSAPTTRATTQAASLTYVVSDAQSDAVSLTITYTATDLSAGAITSGQATGRNQITTSLATSPGGTSYAFQWDWQADLGGSGAALAALEFIARDSTGSSLSVVTTPFLVGNDPPHLVDPGAGLVRVTGSGGNILVEFDLADSSGDLCGVVPEFSIGGGPSQPLTQAKGGALQGLALKSDGSPSSFSFVWDTQAEPAIGLTNATGVVVTLSPSDADPGTPAACAPFPITNNTPPLASIVTPQNDDSGDVAFNYTLVDAEGDPCALGVTFSTDSGTTWQVATERTGGSSEGVSGLAASASGATHKFIWDTVTDVGYFEGQVLLRIEPNDGQAGIAATSTPALSLRNQFFKVGAPLASGRFGVSAGDYTSDTLADLVVIDNSGSVFLYAQGSDGTLLTPVSLGLAGAQRPFLAEVTGDGLLDLVVALGGQITLREQSGALTTFGPGCSAFASGDVTGDGRPDLLGISGQTLWVFPQLATGGLNTAGTAYALGVASNALALGDLDNDGAQDVVTAHGDGTVKVLFQSAGALGNLATYSVGAGSIPRGLASADLTGDGLDDLAVCCSGTNQVALLRQATGFSSPTYWAVGATPWALASIDVNADGASDLACLNRDSASVSVLLQQGGTLVPAGEHAVTKNLVNNLYPEFLTTGDLNSDGAPDLATHGAKLDLLYNDTLGGLGATPTYVAVPQETYSVAAGDIDGNGRLDLAVSHGANASFTIVLQNTHGVLVSSETVQIGDNCPSVAIANFDPSSPGLEVAVAEHVVPGAGRFRIYSRQGGATFTNLWNSSVSEPQYVASGDFNGDGRADLVGAAYLGGIYAYYQTAGGFPAGADYHPGPGGYTGSLVVGDINADGKADIINTRGVSGGLYLHRSAPAGGFVVSYMATPARTDFLALGDVTGDGLQDLVMPCLDGKLWVYAQDGAGGLLPGAGYANPNNLVDAIPAIGDVNGDGLNDLVVCHVASRDRISVHYATSGGGFSPPVTRRLPGAYSVLVTDLNGDDRDDVLVTTQAQRSLTVLIQR